MADGQQVRAVSRLTGLPADTIRIWERRYGLVRPRRDPAGERLYAPPDIEMLELARDATRLGHPIRRVAAMTRADLRSLVRDGQAAVRPAEDSPLLLTRVLEALHRYDSSQVERVLNTAALLLPSEELVLGLLSPLLREVGERWKLGKLEIAHERLISTLVRNLCGSLMRASHESRGRAMLFATPAWDPHEFGILLASALATSRDRTVHSLGACVPVEEVLRSARKMHPTHVVIGSVLPAAEWGDEAYYDRLDAELAPGIRLCLGGPGSAALRVERFSSRVDIFPTLESFAAPRALGSPRSAQSG